MSINSLTNDELAYLLFVVPFIVPLAMIAFGWVVDCVVGEEKAG